MDLCGFNAALEAPLFLIAGPCVVESEQLQIDVAGQLKEMCAALAIWPGERAGAEDCACSRK